MKEQKEAVTAKVQIHRLSQKQTFDSTVVIPSPILESHTPSTLIVSMSFPNRNEASRKRKRRSSDRLYKTIPKLEKDKVSLKKSNAILRKRVH